MEDSISNKETVSKDMVSDDTGINIDLRQSSVHDALLPISVVGGLLGMLAGTLPAAVWVLVFGVSFAPMYTFLPLLIYLGISIFKGCRDKRGFILTCLLSAIGLYLTFLSCQAAHDILKYKMLFTNLPLVTATLIGSSDPFTAPVFSSVYIFPALFTLLGVPLVYELMKHQSKPTATPDLAPDTK